LAYNQYFGIDPVEGIFFFGNEILFNGSEFFVLSFIDPGMYLFNLTKNENIYCKIGKDICGRK
jgi:hypothetical protein